MEHELSSFHGQRGFEPVPRVSILFLKVRLEFKIVRI